MSTLNGCFSSQEIADLYGIKAWTARLVIDRLGLDRRIGRNRIVFSDDLPKLEIAFRTLGHTIPTSPHLQQAAEPAGAPWE